MKRFVDLKELYGLGDMSQEEYEAVSELAVKQLDPELIASIDGIEDIENGSLEKLKKRVDEIFFSSDLDWSEEMIVNIFSYDESGLNRILFGTENHDSFFDYTYFTTIDKLEPERVGDTDTYVTTSHTCIEQYIYVVTLIRDENGKMIAMLDLSGYLDRNARTLYEIKKDIVMKSILLVSCLALLIFLITLYINRKLRKNTEVIQEISNGGLWPS